MTMTNSAIEMVDCRLRPARHPVQCPNSKTHSSRRVQQIYEMECKSTLPRCKKISFNFMKKGIILNRIISLVPHLIVISLVLNNEVVYYFQ